MEIIDKFIKSSPTLKDLKSIVGDKNLVDFLLLNLLYEKALLGNKMI